MTARLDPRALTRDLLRYNTINPPGMERACARHLGALLEAAGFRVAYHEFAGEGHGFRKAETIVAVLEAELAFLQRVLRLA